MRREAETEEEEEEKRREKKRSGDRRRKRREGEKERSGEKQPVQPRPLPHRAHPNTSTLQKNTGHDAARKSSFPGRTATPHASGKRGYTAMRRKGDSATPPPTRPLMPPPFVPRDAAASSAAPAASSTATPAAASSAAPAAASTATPAASSTATPAAASTATPASPPPRAAGKSGDDGRDESGESQPILRRVVAHARGARPDAAGGVQPKTQMPPQRHGACCEACRPRCVPREPRRVSLLLVACLTSTLPACAHTHTRMAARNHARGHQRRAAGRPAPHACRCVCGRSANRDRSQLGIAARRRRACRSGGDYAGTSLGAAARVVPRAGHGTPWWTLGKGRYPPLCARNVIRHCWLACCARWVRANPGRRRRWAVRGLRRRPGRESDSRLSTGRCQRLQRTPVAGIVRAYLSVFRQPALTASAATCQRGEVASRPVGQKPTARSRTRPCSRWRRWWKTRPS